jgi:hypothetical protein
MLIALTLDPPPEQSNVMEFEQLFREREKLCSSVVKKLFLLRDRFALDDKSRQSPDFMPHIRIIAFTNPHFRIVFLPKYGILFYR